jgi:lactate dehydrogenase-like 2-hydroxyacid dehydrogenase
MLITFTTTQPNIPIKIKDLERIGKLEVLKGVYNKSAKTKDILSRTEILLANPKYFGVIDRKVISLFKNLKYLFLMSSGFDWVDIDYAKSRNIIVGGARGTTSISVAEHAWALALTLAKSLQNVTTNSAGVINTQIHGKTVGIFGYGYVGKAIANIAQGFGAEVCYTSSHRLKDLRNRRFLNKDELLRKSDIIFLCLPLTKDTRNYLSSGEIELLKKNAILINTAREDLVENKPLFKALKTGRLFGYGIDTDKRNSTFLKKNRQLRIVSTFHAAYRTAEALEAIYSDTAKDVEAFIKGKPLSIL